MATSAKSKKKPKPKLGRPPINGRAMKRFQVVLDKKTEDGMKSLDDGNLSGGIRKAWDKVKQ